MAHLTCKCPPSMMDSLASPSEVNMIDDCEEDTPTQALDDPFGVEGPSKYQTNNGAENNPDNALEHEPPPKRQIAPKP